MSIVFPRRVAFAVLAGIWALCGHVRAWDYEGHRLVSRLALAALPEDFPAFARDAAAEDRIAFLSGEPDRWRNVPDLPLKQSGGSWTDHYCDLEHILEAGLDMETLTSFRYDFIVQFAAGRAANPGHFPPVDPAKNTDHTREWPGFAPWAITEHFGRLRSGFSYLKVFEELGTADEVANAKANILQVMGMLAHYVGDCAQPLHTTKHYNGWVGENPNGYTTWSGLHTWVDGGFGGQGGGDFTALAAGVGPVEIIPLGPRADGRDPMFVAVLDYLRRQHRQVEPLYELEKAGALGNRGQPMGEAARAFLAGRLRDGGRMLAAIWATAHRHAVNDTYLRAALIKRRAAANGAGR